MNDANGKRMVPLTINVQEVVRRRVKILAAKKNTTMGRLQVQAFLEGLDLMEADQEQKEHLHEREHESL
jgi:hypothetical protein